MRILFFKLILVLPILSLCQKLNHPNKVYNENIEYKKLEKMKDFNILNSNEIKQEKRSIEDRKKVLARIANAPDSIPDSVLTRYSEIQDEIFKYSKFSDNRSRIYWGKVKGKKTNISLPCICLIQNDTLSISSGFGFYGGAFAGALIYDNKFLSYFSEYTDVPMYKQNKDEDNFSKSIDIGAKYQSLILENKPKKNEILTGYLTFLTEPYYVSYSKDSVTERQTVVEMNFRCYIHESNSFK